VESPPSAEPILFETTIDESPPIEVPPPSEALPDVDAEPHEPVEKPASKPRRKPTSRPRRKRTSAKKASAAPPETSEPAEAPAVETPAVETPAADEPESPPSLPPRPKARVVWSPAPTSGVQRTHTLKLTKPAPSRSIPETSMPAREPAPKPPSPPRTKPPAREVPPDADVEARPPVADTPAHDEVPAAPATREQTCDILFWRGYRKAAFYARTFDETGEAVAVAESPFFRPQGTGAPEPTEAAKAAYDALRSQLVAAGWEPVSTGDAWFDETFLLTGAVEPEPE
jgi:hypothetical protein